MSEEQPEALPVRLAKRLCDGISTGHDWPNTDDELLRMQSAAELRRLHAENEALRAQIGQGEPDGWLLIATDAYEAGYGKGLNAKRTGRETENPWRDEPGRGAWAIGYELAKERASTHPAPQQKPLTDEQIEAIYTQETGSLIDDSPWALVDFVRAIKAAHNIGEKK